MVLVSDCPECDKLWRVYAYATRQHLEIMSAQEAAAMADDHRRMMEVEKAVQAAEEWRIIAREAVRDHEAEHKNQTLPNGDLKNPTPH